MTTTDSVFTGSIPAIYDRHLGGLLFAPYAADLARRVAALAPAAVLEIAAGTGIATAALARALSGSAAITASDLNQPMLDFASAKPGLERVAWRQADAMRLPFADAAFDVVACQFGAMFFPDRAAAYREARRVLRPGGRFVFSAWGTIAASPIAATVHEAVAGCWPADPPGFLARTPHGYHDAARIAADIQAAGMAVVSLDAVTLPSRAAAAADPAIGFCQGSPLRGEIVARDPAGLAMATAAATAAVAARFGTGPIEAPMQALVVVAA